MKTICQSKRFGAMLPFIAICLVVLFAAVTLAIDIARIHVTRSELRTATDAAARAGAESLSRLQDSQAAIDAAINIASRNTVAGRSLTILPNQVVLGQAAAPTGDLFNFDPNGPLINAVQVTGSRKAGSPDGPVGLLFAPLFGVSKFEPIQTSTAVRTDRDIALVLDVSGSMADFGRFPALKNALGVFLSELNKTPQKEFVSLTVYSTTSRKKVNLTPNLAALATAFATETPAGFTAIGEGLKTGLNSVAKDPLSRPFAAKTVILMTDGNHNTGVFPNVVADSADKSITIHTITFSKDANQALMKAVAKPSGGISLHAETEQQLISAFEDIARQLTILLID